MPFEFRKAEIADVQLIVPRRFGDGRGWFAETYKASDFAAAGIDFAFVQDNHSVSGRGTVRGLHYQLRPHAQGKLVRVVKGRVWDVAVDVRRSSPTFGRWVGYELDADDGHVLWIPPGFAHGFIALEDDTHLTYKCTDEYHRDSERTILWDDPELAIEWPVPDGVEVTLSEKDAGGEGFGQVEVFD